MDGEEGVEVVVEVGAVAVGGGKEGGGRFAAKRGSVQPSRAQSQYKHEIKLTS